MRPQTYRLFEIVAWPAAVSCGFELLLRGATGDFSGVAATVFTGAMAAVTIGACRWRAAQLRQV